MYWRDVSRTDTAVCLVVVIIAVHAKHNNHNSCLCVYVVCNFLYSGACAYITDVIPVYFCLKSHFKLRVVSEKFEGVPLVKRHQ